jgi:hypothetical protein
LTETTPHKVLLFSADAQIGNMLSWHQKELEWPGEGENNETVNASYLLKRTVLYKVGHHGSRNATLRAKGLELMESTDLVAMIPVDEAWAKDEARGWEHPAEKLLNRINERTKGRIIRSDKIPTEDEPLNKPAEATEEEWRDFVSKLEWDQSPDRLWIQYTISE